MTDLEYMPQPVPQPTSSSFVEVDFRQPDGTLGKKKYPVVIGVPVCESCGYQHVTRHSLPSCEKHNDLNLPCRSASMEGLTICGRHAHGVQKQSRQRREFVAERRAKASLAVVGITPIGNPVDELYALAAEMLATKDYFADIVGTLESYRHTDDKGTEQLDTRVALYERALVRCEKVLTSITKLGIDERKIALEEQRAMLVFTFLNGVLTELGLSIDRPEVRATLEKWSPVLDGAASPIIDLPSTEVV